MIGKNILQKARELQNSGNVSECLKFLENNHEALQVVSGKTPEDVKDLVLGLDALGQGFFTLARQKEGLATLRMAVESLRKYLVQSYQHDKSLQALLARLLQNYSFAALELGLIDESLDASREALALASRTFAKDSHDLADVYFSVSAAWYRARDLDTAETFTQKALSIWKNPSNPNPEKTATCMNNLGRIYEERGLLKTGIEWHRKAVAARRKLPDKADLAFSLGNLGVALAFDQNWLEAADCLAECTEIYAEIGQGASRECKGFAANLKNCLTVINEEDKKNEHGHPAE